MASTQFLRVEPQRHDMDCAVACLAMLLGVSYELSLLAFRKHEHIFMRDVKTAAKRLGTTLLLRRKFDLETDTGILGLRSPKWHCEHLAVLKEGIVIDTDATIWDVDVFLVAYEAQALSLLVVQE